MFSSYFSASTVDPSLGVSIFVDLTGEITGFIGSFSLASGDLVLRGELRSRYALTGDKTLVYILGLRKG